MRKLCSRVGRLYIRLALDVLILCIEELRGSQWTETMPLCPPGTNRAGPRLEFHSQRCLLQLAHSSLELTTHGSMPRQALETVNVLYGAMGFGQYLGLFEHGCSLR
jgi:hypothetical protein